MKTETITTWVFLLLLTISAAFFSNLNVKYVAFIILFLAALKFLGIAFQFMELKKAHVFWKVSILVFLVLFTTTLLLLLG